MYLRLPFTPEGIINCLRTPPRHATPHIDNCYGQCDADSGSDGCLAAGTLDWTHEGMVHWSAEPHCSRILQLGQLVSISKYRSTTRYQSIKVLTDGWFIFKVIIHFIFYTTSFFSEYIQ